MNVPGGNERAANEKSPVQGHRAQDASGNVQPSAMLPLTVIPGENDRKRKHGCKIR
jgi:hypothetical protein